MPLRDSHTHLLHAGMECLVSAVREADWERLLTEGGEEIALGVHPWYSAEWSASSAAHLRRLLEQRLPCIVAVGEIGLDFAEPYRQTVSEQERCFAEQFRMAREFQLPVVLHLRKAWERFFAFLGQEKVEHMEGICHGFTGSYEIARKLLDVGLKISVGVDLLRSAKLQEAVRRLPPEMVLTETDATAENGRGEAELRAVTDCLRKVRTE